MNFIWSIIDININPSFNSIKMMNYTFLIIIKIFKNKKPLKDALLFPAIESKTSTIIDK